jgi:HSP20 family protein
VTRIARRPGDPFRDLFAAAPGVTQLLEAHLTSSSGGGSWLPPLDVYETPSAYVVVVDVPGVPLDRLDVVIEAGVLTVSGDRRFHACVSEESFHRVERRFGSFARSVALPSAKVDADSVTARVAEGVLTVEIPKAPEAQPRHIPVVEESGR